MALGKLLSANADFSLDAAASATALILTATPGADEIAISRGRSTSGGSEVSGNIPLSDSSSSTSSSSPMSDSASTETASTPPAETAFRTASTSAADFASV